MFGGGWMIVKGSRPGSAVEPAPSGAKTSAASQRAVIVGSISAARYAFVSSLVVVFVIRPLDIKYPARPADERGRGTTCWFAFRGAPLIAATGIRIASWRAIGRRPHGSRATS